MLWIACKPMVLFFYLIGEDYKLLLEKREGTRNEYETKMIEASKASSLVVA